MPEKSFEGCFLRVFFVCFFKSCRLYSLFLEISAHTHYHVPSLTLISVLSLWFNILLFKFCQYCHCALTFCVCVCVCVPIAYSGAADSYPNLRSSSGPATAPGSAWPQHRPSCLSATRSLQLLYTALQVTQIFSALFQLTF